MIMSVKFLSVSLVFSRHTPMFFAFAVSTTDFSSPARRIYFSRRIVYCACVNSFSYFAEKKRSWIRWIQALKKLSALNMLWFLEMCFFRLNESNKVWLKAGCSVYSSNSTHTVCHCFHLTNFALLMDMHGVQVGRKKS
jgi:hypothetical protein